MENFLKVDLTSKFNDGDHLPHHFQIILLLHRSFCPVAARIKNLASSIGNIFLIETQVHLSQLSFFNKRLINMVVEVKFIPLAILLKAILRVK